MILSDLAKYAMTRNARDLSATAELFVCRIIVKLYFLCFTHNKINVKNFHGSLTTVVRAQMTPLKQQISLIPFSIEYWYRALTSDGVFKIVDQTFCILLIKYALSVNLHCVTRPIAYYYYYNFRQ